MHLGRAFHLTKGLIPACWPLVLGYDMVSRVIQGKEAEKANGNSWDLSFPEDSARLPLPSPKAGGTGSMVCGREAVIQPSPLGAWKRLTYSCTWPFSKRAEKSSSVGQLS